MAEQMQGAESVRLLPGQRLRKGVLVTSDESGLRVDLHVVLENGVNMKSVCENLASYVSFALAEIARRATDGREDWLAWPEARAPALLTPRLRLDGDVFPTLSDTAADMAPDPFVAFFVATRLGEGGVPPPPRDGALPFPHAFLLTPSAAASAAVGASLPPIVWLPKAQLLIGRAPAMAFFAAGGHNGVSHNHNDLGVFGVAVGGVSVLADLGGESYSARTFSSKRYDSPLLNSWGHAVPRPAETLQAAGKAAAAKTRAFEEEAGESGYLAPFISNHDMDRWGTYFSGVEDKSGLEKLAAAMMILSPGTPWMYYGEEILMSGVRGEDASSDALRRQGMVWGDGVEKCKTPENRADTNGETVGALEAQKDPQSLYQHYKRAINLRNARNDIFEFGSFAQRNLNQADMASWMAFDISYGGKNYLLVHHKAGEEGKLALQGNYTVLDDLAVDGTAASYADGALTAGAYASILLEEGK